MADLLTTMAYFRFHWIASFISIVFDVQVDIILLDLVLSKLAPKCIFRLLTTTPPHGSRVGGPVLPTAPVKVLSICKFKVAVVANLGGPYYSTTPRLKLNASLLQLLIHFLEEFLVTLLWVQWLSQFIYLTLLVLLVVLGLWSYLYELLFDVNALPCCVITIILQLQIGLKYIIVGLE